MGFDIRLYICRARYRCAPGRVIGQKGGSADRNESGKKRNTMMKDAVIVLLSTCVLFAGCAGREANPIPIYLPGDENRSCAGLKGDIAQLQADMQRLLPKTNKGVTNALWATAGVFVIVPFFFMDLKDAEKTEFDAMRRRHNRLLIYAAEKGCEMSGVTAEKILSIEERKEAAKKQSEKKGGENKATN